MTYREMALKVVEIACKDLMERADDILPKTDGITCIDLKLHIPTITDESWDIPTITVSTDAYTSPLAIKKIIDLIAHV